MFQVGQKVVCIDDGPYRGCKSDPLHGGTAVVRNKTYTIREIACVHPGAPEEACVRLAEVTFTLNDCPVAAYRFRPLTDSPKAVKETMRKHFNKFLDVKESA